MWHILFYRTFMGRKPLVAIVLYLVLVNTCFWLKRIRYNGFFGVCLLLYNQNGRTRYHLSLVNFFVGVLVVKQVIFWEGKERDISFPSSKHEAQSTAQRASAVPWSTTHETTAVGCDAS